MSEKLGSVFLEFDAKTEGIERGGKVAEKTLDDVERKAKQTEGSFSSLKRGALVLGSALAALQLGRILTDQLQQSVRVASDATEAIDRFNQVYGTMGPQAEAFAEDIASSVGRVKHEVMDGMAAFHGMAIGYGLASEEAFKMSTRLQELSIDFASFNNMTDEEALQRFISAMSGSSEVLDRFGINIKQSALDLKLQEKGLADSTVEATEMEKAIARLAIIEETMGRQGALGDAVRTADSFENRMKALRSQFENLRLIVGRSIIPMIEYLMDSLSGASKAGSALVFAVRAISSVFIGLISLARQLGIAISTVGSALFALATGDFRLAKNVVIGGFEDMLNEGVRTQETLTRVWGGETSKQTDIATNSYQDQADAHDAKAEKIKKDLAEETEEFEKQQERRRKEFNRRLADLIFKHQDKVKSIKEDLAEETRSYRISLEERQKEHAETMSEIEERHKAKVETIEKQLDREQKKQEEKVAKAIKDGEAQLKEEEKQFKKRESIIESQIENELSKGERASQSVLNTLNTRLENERAIHKLKVEEIKKQIDEETSKAINSNQDRIEDLQESLEKEKKSFKKEKEERKTDYEEETAILKKEHEKRVTDLQIRLDEEQTILERHQDDVDAVKDQARLDDIARLKLQFEEQNQIEQEEHQKRLEDIRKQGREAGVTMGQHFADGLRSAGPGISNEASTIGTDVIRSAGSSGRKHATSEGRSVMDNFISGLKWTWNNRKHEITRLLLFRNLLSPFFGSMSSILGIPGFAGGVENFRGGLAVVGEAGPELVRLPRGSDVIPNEEAFGSQAIGGSYNVYIDKINERSDVDMIVRELGFKANLT